MRIHEDRRGRIIVLDPPTLFRSLTDEGRLTGISFTQYAVPGMDMLEARGMISKHRTADHSVAIENLGRRRAEEGGR
jgi:hypothetical protein